MSLFGVEHCSCTELFEVEAQLSSISALLRISALSGAQLRIKSYSSWNNGNKCEAIQKQKSYCKYRFCIPTVRKHILIFFQLTSKYSTSIWVYFSFAEWGFNRPIHIFMKTLGKLIPKKSLPSASETETSVVI